MPDQIDLNILNQLLSEDLIEHIQNIFDLLISDLSEYLGIKPIDNNVKIELFSVNNSEIEQSVRILDQGVKRLYKDRTLFIQIFEKNRSFIPFILLREVYYLFLPKAVKDNQMIKIYINQILENDLQKANG
ncbi:MAG: hypothetical protein ACXAAH_17270, partial [Promethearchaeota archaeon]